MRVEQDTRYGEIVVVGTWEEGGQRADNRGEIILDVEWKEGRKERRKSPERDMRDNYRLPSDA